MIAVVSLPLRDTDEEVHRNGNAKWFLSANHRNDRYRPQPAPSRHLRVVGYTGHVNNMEPKEDLDKTS
jgi:hypothetical protein